MTNDVVIPEKIIRTVTGRAVPKPEDNQDTDRMVYGGALNEISFRGYGKQLFAKERFKDGILVPDHPLNDLRYAGANILIGGDNYGCGSSREHAPQAHLDAGFRGLITAGYAGIFQANCGSIGLVAVTVPKSDIKTLAEMVKKYPQTGFTIDLEDKNLGYNSREGPTGIMPFEIPENIREAFLKGAWDKIVLSRQNPDAVKAKMQEIPYFSFQ